MTALATSAAPARAPRRAVTVTLNAAIDQTVRLARLQRGHVHRALGAREDAGGKGINAAACLADWGVPTTALGVLGSDNDEVFRALFKARGITDACLRLPGSTRTNIKLVEDDGAETTDINLPGLVVNALQLEQLAAQLDRELVAAGPVVLSGSLPEGLPADTWARLQAQAGAAGARVILDTSGEALAAALDSATPPYAVKPNRQELQEWMRGRDLGGRGLLDAGHALLERGIALVVISLGGDGALFIARGEALIARPARLVRASTVGAGDAMVAGIAAALLQPALTLEACARLATAFSVSRLASGDRRRVDPVQVRELIGTVVVERLA